MAMNEPDYRLTPQEIAELRVDKRGLILFAQEALKGWVPKMLTRSEIESLKRDRDELVTFAQEVMKNFVPTKKRAR